MYVALRYTSFGLASCKNFKSDNMLFPSKLGLKISISPFIFTPSIMVDSGFSHSAPANNFVISVSCFNTSIQLVISSYSFSVTTVNPFASCSAANSFPALVLRFAAKNVCNSGVSSAACKCLPNFILCVSFLIFPCKKA